MANIVACADGTWNRPEEDFEKDFRSMYCQGCSFVTLPGLVMVRALTLARIGYAKDIIPGPFRGRFNQTVFH